MQTPELLKLNLNRNPNHWPLPTSSYKKTVQYDPRNSETYRAIQEEGGYSNYGQSSPQEVTIPVQTKVYQPNRLVPGKVRSCATVRKSSKSLNQLESVELS